MFGLDGKTRPSLEITFSNGNEVDIAIPKKYLKPPCVLNTVVPGQERSSFLATGCLFGPRTDDRDDDRYMHIRFQADIDSGSYNVYYATPYDKNVTVKKMSKRRNIAGNKED